MLCLLLFGPAGPLQVAASQAQNFPLGPGDPPIESGVDEQEPFLSQQELEEDPFAPDQEAEERLLELEEDSGARACKPGSEPLQDVRRASIELELKANQQRFDSALQRFVAAGNVTLVVAGGRLKADRLEYDAINRVIWARGAVQFQRGNQYLQGSLLRYNLLQGEGELQDVYGVLDLRTSPTDLDPDAPLQRNPVERRLIEHESTLTRAQRERRRRELQEDIAVPDPDEMSMIPRSRQFGAAGSARTHGLPTSRFAGVAFAASRPLGGDCVGRSDDRCHVW